MFAAIKIERAVYSVVRREMDTAPKTETGGALVGYIDGELLVVTNASGPGPRAVRKVDSVVIDGVHAQLFCDEMRRLTSGRDDYVGDWHCHPSWSIKPSDLDSTAMATMAAFEFSPITFPVSLIWSKWSRRVLAYRYDPTLAKLVRIRIRHRCLCLKGNHLQASLNQGRARLKRRS
jgi:integrative and conjugative element protein (TIGR02256 family)